MVSRCQKRIPSTIVRAGSCLLQDRIAIHIEVPRVEYEKVSDERLGEPSAAIQARLQADAHCTVRRSRSGTAKTSE